jgi:hypothetical protein
MEKSSNKFYNNSWELRNNTFRPSKVTACTWGLSTSQWRAPLVSNRHQPPKSWSCLRQ